MSKHPKVVAATVGECMSLDLIEARQAMEHANAEVQRLSAVLECVALDRLEEGPPPIIGEFG